ncbi:MAG: biopolymer transporter ExbD [Elusimicrobiales bacterium]|jgi:biopolymer transport protein ExbD
MQTDQGSEDPITGINVTPLVDVSLVLVIVFMITMPFLVEKGLNIKSSEQKIVPTSSINEPILVEISGKAVTIEGREAAPEAFVAVLKKTMADRGVYAVSVSPSLKTLHGEVIAVIDGVMTAGAQNLNLIEPEEAGNVDK